ncbi:hypothetical protein [Burkholderia sp. Tr-862]|uniref:hypothetical protein n=1 Tax=Burkholderia sp. Tr-862 TaxID=2608331 RepID=UPI0014194365|nr:hypothetical protein [Burkholderia sp. Tr-862]
MLECQVVMVLRRVAGGRASGLDAGGMARAIVSVSCSFGSVLRPAAGRQLPNEMHRDVACADGREVVGDENFCAAEAKCVERNRLRGLQCVRLLASDGIKNESLVSNFF